MNYLIVGESRHDVRLVLILDKKMYIMKLEYGRDVFDMIINIKLHCISTELNTEFVELRTEFLKSMNDQEKELFKSFSWYKI